MGCEAEPVFVVGVNGSGTTMVADALGQHPALYMLPRETRLLPGLLQSNAAAARPQQLRTVADTLGRSKAFWRENGQAPVLLPDQALAGAHCAADAVGAVYLHLAQRAGKQRWGDKTPMYVQHLLVLGRAFPRARFVHVVRDGRDCAQSFHRRWGLSPLRSVWRWKKAVAAGRAQGRQLGPDRYAEIRYEDLTADPEAGMRRLCDFLALPFTPEVLKSRMRYFDPASELAQSGAMVPNSQRWMSYFDAVTTARLEAIAGRVLHELGYPVQRQGNQDLASWQLAWLKWSDWSRMSLQHLRRSRRGDGMRALLLRAREARAQDRANPY